MARSFNGTSDQIRMDTIAPFWQPTSAFGFACWLKGAASQTNKFIYGEGLSSSASANSLGLSSADTGDLNRAHFFSRNSANSVTNSIYTTGDVFDATWHHLIFTHDSSGSYAWYIDGVADATGTLTTTGTFSTNRAALGALPRSTVVNFLSVTMTGAALWLRKLSAGEAQLLASGTSASLLAPTHYWPLFGADSPEPDLGVGAHVTGTLTGTAFAAGKDPVSLLDLAGATAR